MTLSLRAYSLQYLDCMQKCVVMRDKYLPRCHAIGGDITPACLTPMRHHHIIIIIITMLLYAITMNIPSS